MTNYSEKQIYEKLFQIFIKYKKRYKNPPRSTQMACMWSTQNPPDIIEETPPFHEIENAFNIKIDEDDNGTTKYWQTETFFKIYQQENAIFY